MTTSTVSLFTVAVGALVALTNIIVQVIKKATWDKLPTNLLAVLVSIALTLIAFFAWVGYTGLVVLWYYVAAAVIVGFMVAYAAMFGFDKLQEVITKVTSMGSK